MEQQCGDCDSVFSHQGQDDGHAFVFGGRSFHFGEGYNGEMNKLFGNALDVGDRLKLICQFCQNLHLKYLRVDSQSLELVKYLNATDHAHLIWTTLMRELQGNASLEYLEFWYFPDFFEDRKTWMRSMFEMLSTNSSLVGFKMWFPVKGDIDVISFMEAVSSNKTLQLLHLTFNDIGLHSAVEALKLLVASLIEDSTGYQSNTRLRAVFMNTKLASEKFIEKTTFDNDYVNETIMGHTIVLSTRNSRP